MSTKLSRFITPSGLILREIDNDNSVSFKQMASAVHLTQRQVYALVHDLVEDGVISVERKGRHNHYTIAGPAGWIADAINKALLWEGRAAHG